MVNLDHIIGINPCGDESQITFDSVVTTPCECEQRNYMYVKESYAWLKYKLTGVFAGKVPERYVNKKD